MSATSRYSGFIVVLAPESISAGFSGIYDAFFYSVSTYRPPTCVRLLAYIFCFQ
jgi:hypothetical protein